VTSEQRDRYIHEEQVMIPMRDGTRLAAGILRPSAEGTFPTVLVRTPYDKTNQRLAAPAWVDAGYAYVRQDVRGRFDSAGEFYPYRNDPEDGYDTIEWIARQPWSNGAVGQTGESHVGTVQYLAAPTRPPHLKAMVPGFAPASVFHYWWYQGGAFRLSFNLSWLVLLAQDNLRHFPRRAEALEEARRQVWVTPEDMKALQIEPLLREWSFRDFPLLEGLFGNSWFTEFMEHPEYSAFWQPYDFATQHKDMDTPMLHAGGWYDTFLQGTIDSYLGMRSNAKSEAAREAQKLIVGPWQHVSWGRSTVGDLDYGPEVMTLDPFQTRKRWFDHWLRGIDSGLMDEAPVLIFVMGANIWRPENEWPLARAWNRDFFLHADGRLDQTQPHGERPRTYRYDAKDPVIALGGCEWVNYPCGPYDQKPLDGRADVLTFQTAPLEEDVEVTGRVSAHVWASSTCADTDFTAKLVDVHPDGRAFNICDGIVRGRYRESLERAVLLEPGRPYEVRVDLWSTSQMFRRGHRIRLDISSSNFPRFDANPNTGEPPFTLNAGRVRRVVAENTVYFDRERPSRLVLPIVGR